MAFMKESLYSRMRKRAWERDRFATISFVFFVAVSVAMLSLTVMLFTNLTGAIDNLMKTAKTPDYLQMHTGVIDEEALVRFAESEGDIEDYQVLSFLNLDNSILSIGGHSLIDSTQDNGLCVQGNGFDYMLDMNNELPAVGQGQVYVPVCYEAMYDIKVGAVLKIGDEELLVAGFIRDSQMNSMMASSKRFLVCEEEYERLRALGSEEYLIEFLLAEGTDTNAFKTAYENAGLPMNGPTITGPLVKMMNTLSDGIMIFIILLISTLVLGISLVCIRFMLLTRVAAESREVGMMKAVGISGKDIRFMFLGRYRALVLIGVMAGVAISAVMFQPLSAQMQRLYGVSSGSMGNYLFAVLGGAAVGGVIILFILRVLKRLNKVTAVNALTGASCEGKKKGSKLCIAFVTAIAVFLMMIPTNLYSTLSSPAFVAYMGIGNAEIRMDLRENENSRENFHAVEGLLEKDEAVSEYALFKTCRTPVRLVDGTAMNMLLEQGNHTQFPVKYSRGAAPSGEGEVALSYLLSEELGLFPGDVLYINQEGEFRKCTVSGIYSDITNGGKTAKLYVENVGDKELCNVLWRIAYITLRGGTDSKAFMEKYSAAGAEVTDIASRVAGTYGSTLNQVRQADILVKLIACIIILFVIILFVRMLIANLRNQVSIKKALGFKSVDIKRSFRKSCAGYITGGVVAGSAAGCILGEKICGFAISSLGAVGFRFELSVIPIVINLFAGGAAAAIAVCMGSKGVEKIKAVECCRERE